MGVRGDANKHNWRELGKCSELTPGEADKLFFPGPGGKSNKAKKFCNDCPVVGNCLELALAVGTYGFFAGTTEDDRKAMREFIDDLPMPSIAETMPKEPTRKTRRLRPVKSSTPERSFDTVEGPTFVEEMKMLGETG